MLLPPGEGSPLTLAFNAAFVVGGAFFKKSDFQLIRFLVNRVPQRIHLGKLDNAIYELIWQDSLVKRRALDVSFQEPC